MKPVHLVSSLLSAALWVLTGSISAKDAGPNGEKPTKSSPDMNALLPEAVTQRIKTDFPGAEFKGSRLVTSLGISYYDVQMFDKGEDVGARITADGKLLDATLRDSNAKLTQAAINALEREVGAGRVWDATMRESFYEIKLVPRSKPTTFHEILWLRDGASPVTVAVTEDGRIYPVDNSSRITRESSTGGKGLKIQLPVEQMPGAVRAALQKRIGSNTVTRAEKEIKQGVDVYTVRWTLGGKDQEARVAADGSLLESRETVTLADLPSTAQRAINQSMPGTTSFDITRRTTLSQDNPPIVVYDVRSSDPDQRAPSIRILADGTIEQRDRGSKNDKIPK